MKNVLMAVVAASVSFVGAASAGELGFGGYGEYAVEAEAFEFGLNASYNVNAFTLGTDVVFVESADDAIELDNVTLSVNYAANGYVDFYSKIEFDDELNYEETTVGVAFDF